ncbi:MAG TPA: lactate racemase domain-containing protein [Planctomycetota bacterium]|nr:lactate racemase domain-containing protein [Planctomycetota bacterium]
MLKMIPVRQKFPASPPLDVRASLRRDFKPKLKPGTRIAVGAGSRGITNLAAVVGEVVAILRDAGAKSFIVPAMGSHGGATPEGQIQILSEYGVTEAAMGVPIHASMETVELGTTEDGVPVRFGKAALDSDGIVVINRVKPHTDFGGPLGSGIVKMIAIGFGKQAGAAAYHAAASRLGMERVIRTVSKVVLPKVPILAAVALLEDTYHATAKIVVLPAGEVETREEEIQAEARRLMPKLPFDEMDLLIVDRLGKNISGAGMDPNITGRGVHGYTSKLSEQKTRPLIRRLYVRDLTPESHGNAIGIGMADFTTTRLAASIDAAATGMNALTSLSINSFKIPLAFDNDRIALPKILGTVPLSDGQPHHVIRIHDTLNLGTVEVSESYAAELAARADLEALGPAREMVFGPDGNLPAIGS